MCGHGEHLAVATEHGAGVMDDLDAAIGFAYQSQAVVAHGAAAVLRPLQHLFPAACAADPRSEEHTSELQSLMRISYAVFCLKKKKKSQHIHNHSIITQ